MTSNNSRLRTDIDSPLAAHDALYHARSMIEFLQDVLTVHPEAHLPENIRTTGLYFIMQDIKDRIIDANVMLQASIQSANNVVPIKIE